jgi:hypothetical protein
MSFWKPCSSYYFANIMVHRWLPPHPPDNLYVCRLHPTLARHPGPPLCTPILVRKVSNVLDACRLGTILRRVDIELPPCTAGQCEHQRVGHRVRQHDCAGRRGTRSSLGACHSQADARRSGKEAREGRGYGIQSRPEARVVRRKEGAVVYASV